MLSLAERKSDRLLEQLREEALHLLETNFAHDVISVEEYEKRVDIALNTSIEADLVRISRDLTPLSGNKPDEQRSRQAVPSHSRGEELIVGILGEVKRRGEWSPAKSNRIFTLMGGVRLDFTRVELPAGVTEINFFCIMGSLDIIVPEGIRVDLSGIPIMGSIDNRVKDPGASDCPVIKIRGLTLMGSVDVKPPRKRRVRRRR